MTRPCSTKLDLVPLRPGLPAATHLAMGRGRKTIFAPLHNAMLRSARHCYAASGFHRLRHTFRCAEVDERLLHSTSPCLAMQRSAGLNLAPLHPVSRLTHTVANVCRSKDNLHFASLYCARPCSAQLSCVPVSRLLPTFLWAEVERQPLLRCAMLCSTKQCSARLGSTRSPGCWTSENAQRS
jgi:hypothetical protein